VFNFVKFVPSTCITADMGWKYNKFVTIFYNKKRGIFNFRLLNDNEEKLDKMKVLSSHSQFSVARFWIGLTVPILIMGFVFFTYYFILKETFDEKKNCCAEQVFNLVIIKYIFKSKFNYFSYCNKKGLSMFSINIGFSLPQKRMLKRQKNKLWMNNFI